MAASRVPQIRFTVQVDFDRNAAKRTNVIDDQSDFFEIDSNAWLSDEVYCPRLSKTSPL